MELNKLRFQALDTYKVTFMYAPYALVLNIVLSVMTGVITPVMVILTAKFINSAISLVTNGSGKREITLILLLISLCQVLIQIGGIFIKLTEKQMENRLRSKLVPYILKKGAKLRFDLIENENSLNLINRVFTTPESRFVGIISDASKMLIIGIQVVGVFVVMANQVWWAPFLFMLLIIPLVSIFIKSGKDIYEKDREITGLNRIMKYYSAILTNRDASAERNLFGFSVPVDHKFQRAHKVRTDATTKKMIKWMIISKLYGVVLVVFTVLMMLYLLHQIESGELSAGLFISLMGSTMALIYGVSWQIGDLLDNIQGHKEYLVDLTQFMSFEEQPDVLTTRDAKIDFDYIEFINLSFRYPGTEKYILKNLNIRFDKGKHYAMIGINGAGKTTLIKLMTGLYQIQEGRIVINGRDINSFSYNELISIFSVVFQDFAKYQITYKENITMGSEEGALSETIRKVGLEETINKLPNGVNTLLGKLADEGVDLSGGEWQKLAIAREVNSPAPFKIFDEPTAALSPLAESELYSRFGVINSDNTTLMISHRLGSTKFADFIYVLNEGSIGEKGTHNELMVQKGIYYKMFESQKRWYDEEQQKSLL